MLYGLRIQQNERESKLKKSQLYREMLDKQIQINQHYRQPKAEINTLKHSQIYSSFQHMPIIQRRGQEQLQTSFIHEIEKQQPNRNLFLPLLKDSNKFMKGVSRFVKVDQPLNKKNKQLHVYTEMIEQQDNDGYDQVCSKIIRDLQDIKNKPVKAKNRRKLYGNTQLQPHRRNRLYTEVNLQGENRPNKDPFNESKNHQFMKQPQLNSSKKAVRHKPTQIKLQKTQPNQFQTMNPKDQSRLKMNQFQQEKSSLTQERRNKNKDHDGQNLNRSLNYKLDSHSPSTSQLQNRKIQTRTKVESSKDEKQLTNNNLLQKQRKNNKSASYNQTDSPRGVESKLEAQSATRLQIQRQKFLHVLRKVKNRGESLYLKLARYPNDKNITNQ